MKSAYIVAVSHNGHPGGDDYKYEDGIPSVEHLEVESRHPSADFDADHHPLLDHHLRDFKKRNKSRVMKTGMGALGIFLFFWLAIAGHAAAKYKPCDSVEDGYTCSPGISHFWGQYSPYFSVPSEIPNYVPDTCQITFAQVLSRHGARDPTLGKTIAYAALLARIHSHVTSHSEPYAFIKDYEYTLGADQLSVFGQQQMINSGVKFYNHYRTLAKNVTPFIRASGQDRVVESAQNWTQGFHSARVQDSAKDSSYPYNIVVISEDTGSNNTLNHGLCTVFEDSAVGSAAQKEWVSIFTPPIAERLNKNLPGANISNVEAVYMMDLCPFNTVADLHGAISPFCNLFTEDEWKAYDYYQSLGKYYGYGWGNPLGATQGVGFTNELIARLTASPVHDCTSTNSTLDKNPETFPVGGTTALYADFTHDNDLTGIFSALGLYNATRPLLNTTVESIKETNGYSAAWTASFAARAYFEKMSCVGEKEELVRILVNDRVIPLDNCGRDQLGRCKLGRFVESLSFARVGGEWEKCFV